jgi:ABC-type phosphate transport system permease subunit
MALRQVPQGLGEAAYALGATDRVISLLSRILLNRSPASRSSD